MLTVTLYYCIINVSGLLCFKHLAASKSQILYKEYQAPSKPIATCRNKQCNYTMSESCELTGDILFADGCVLHVQTTLLRETRVIIVCKVQFNDPEGVEEVFLIPIS